MSRSVHLTLNELKSITEDEQKTDSGAREVDMQEVGEEVNNPDNSSSALSTILRTIDNIFEREWFDEAVTLPFANGICKSDNNQIQGNIYSVPHLGGL